MNGTKQQRQQQTMFPGIYLDVLPPHLAGEPRDYFTYGVTFDNIPAGGVGTQFTNIQEDSHFLVTSINAVAIGPSGSVGFLPFTVELLSTGSGRQLQNVPIHLETLRGNGQLPGFLPYPKLLGKGTQFQTRLSNLDATNAYQVFMSYGGFKVFTNIGL